MVPLLNLIIARYATAADHLQIKDYVAGRHVKYPHSLGPSCTIPQSIGEIARYIQVIW